MSSETKNKFELEIVHVLFIDIVGYSKLRTNEQRASDCGDAGHILLSKRVAEDLEQSGDWQTQLHDLGEVEVKHGVRVHVFNLYTEDVGNPEVPEKLRNAKPKEQEPDVSTRWE